MTTERTKEQARDIRHKIAEMIPGEYTPVLDDELNRMLIEQVEKIKAECIAIVKSHYHSFDNDYYVCLPPQDVISDILASLEDTE